jgi:hypothetical protein
MFYALSNTLVNIRNTEIIVPPNNNGYKSPSLEFYVAPNQKYYIQPAP